MIGNANEIRDKVTKYGEVTEKSIDEDTYQKLEILKN